MDIWQKNDEKVERLKLLFPLGNSLHGRKGLDPLVGQQGLRKLPQKLLGQGRQISRSNLRIGRCGCEKCSCLFCCLFFSLFWVLVFVCFLVRFGLFGLFVMLYFFSLPPSPLFTQDLYLVEDSFEIIGLGVEVGFQLRSDVFDPGCGAGNSENSFLLQPGGFEMRENPVEDQRNANQRRREALIALEEPR